MTPIPGDQMWRLRIAHPIMALIGFLIIGGIGWIALYYGAILPIYNSISGGYGPGIYDSNTITFVLAIAGYFPFILTLGGVWWLWQRSQKPDGY